MPYIAKIQGGLIEVKEIKACRKCKHWTDGAYSGDLCKRVYKIPKRIDVYNLVTGASHREYHSRDSLLSCDTERHTKSRRRCGINGKFFKPK